MHKTVLLILALAYTSLLTIVNFITLQSIPEIGLGIEDKIYHVLAYMVFSVFWALWYVKQFKAINPTLLIFFGLFYGVTLESFQHIVNPSRTFDPYDMLANCLGVVIGIVFVTVLIKQKVKLN